MTTPPTDDNYAGDPDAHAAAHCAILDDFMADPCRPRLLLMFVMERDGPETGLTCAAGAEDLVCVNHARLATRHTFGAETPVGRVIDALLASRPAAEEPAR